MSPRAPTGLNDNCCQWLPRYRKRSDFADVEVNIDDGDEQDGKDDPRDERGVVVAHPKLVIVNHSEHERREEQHSEYGQADESCAVLCSANGVSDYTLTFHFVFLAHARSPDGMITVCAWILL